MNIISQSQQALIWIKSKSGEKLDQERFLEMNSVMGSDPKKQLMLYTGNAQLSETTNGWMQAEMHVICWGA